MTAARGDRRPCRVEACPGEMQYGRRSDHEHGTAALRGSRRDDPLGWVCSETPEHFTSDSAAAIAAASADPHR